MSAKITRREVGLSHFSSQVLSFKFIGLVNAVSTQVRTQTLINDIFHDYDNTQIPICSDGVNTTVILDMALRQIVNMVSIVPMHEVWFVISEHRTLRRDCACAKFRQSICCSHSQKVRVCRGRLDL